MFFALVYLWLYGWIFNILKMLCIINVIYFRVSIIYNMHESEHSALHMVLNMTDNSSSSHLSVGHYSAQCHSNQKVPASQFDTDSAISESEVT